MRQSRVLIVDDDEDTGEMLAELLERDGFAAQVVLRGHEAVAAALTHESDVIVLDMVLKDTDGLDVLRQLRANEQTRTVPVIVVTAGGLLQGRERALERGAVAAFIKPVELSVLVNAIRAALV